MAEIGSILLSVVALLASAAAIVTALVAFVRLLRRPKPGIPPFLVTRQQQDWQQWLRDQVADAVRVIWVFPGQVPSYQANGYVMERKTASGAEIRTTDLASPDLAAHGYMVLMTMRRR